MSQPIEEEMAGQRVKHWFAGEGTVRHRINTLDVMVDWDRGKAGVARLVDLRFVEREKTRQ